MRLALWFLALAVVILGTWMLWGGGWESHFSFAGSVRWLESSGRWAWAAGILLLASDLVLPVPGTVVISALGYIYGTFSGGVVASVGLMAAGLLGYGAGRLFGEKFARRWLGDRDFETGRKLFENGGGWLVALSRALPILPEVISCTAGLVRMPFRRFAIALACGSVPMGFLFAAIGTTGRDAPGWAFALSLIIPALLWLVAGRLRKSTDRDG
jgi:uncharacterized membrane protein YdjX (TVP38/TMEM64 family)